MPGKRSRPYTATQEMVVRLGVVVTQTQIGFSLLKGIIGL